MSHQELGKLIAALSLGGAISLMSGCSTTQSSKTDVSRVSHNICSITRASPDYQKAALLAEQKWGTPANILLAIVHQESRFQSEARPRMKYVGGVPVGHISSAYGYSQALDGTWEEYKQKTGNFSGQRNDIYDAMDFIGWYNQQTYHRSGVSKNDAYNLYLAYHEGQGGYNRGTYNKKPWLKRVAKKVKNQAYAYDNQMDNCTLYVEAEEPKKSPKPTQQVAKRNTPTTKPARPSADQLADNGGAKEQNVADLFGKASSKRSQKTNSADLPSPNSCRNWPYC